MCIGAPNRAEPEIVTRPAANFYAAPAVKVKSHRLNAPVQDSAGLDWDSTI
jgi:hypothetical protein